VVTFPNNNPLASTLMVPSTDNKFASPRSNVLDEPTDTPAKQGHIKKTESNKQTNKQTKRTQDSRR
jgi:hypothetical protein